MKFLVIVESPAKTQKIKKFLDTIPGHSFIVDASYGHIRYFKNGLKSIDINDRFKPTYSVVSDKAKVVKKLRDLVKKVDEVIIATDRDREGEAIGYHLIKVLKLKLDTTKRIHFNEITEEAIVSAFHSPETLNMKMFHAQQARSILDLLIGFKVSPLLWKHIESKLSAGRCQTPALKLVSERDEEIKNFSRVHNFNISALFRVNSFKLDTDFCKRTKELETTEKWMKKLIKHTYTLSLENIKQTSNSPPPPFITSTIQQAASTSFNISPKNTMSILQKLYEGGKITYMRTDCTNVSKEFKQLAKVFINERYPSQFTDRTFKTKSKGAQEAHECIRPVLLDILPSDIGDSYERKLYTLIRQRTIACFMPNYNVDHYNYRFTSTKNNKAYFTCSKLQIMQNGFKSIYNASINDDSKFIKTLKIKSEIEYSPGEIIGTEKYTKPLGKYTEASLVKALEKKGIGRPSTFSSIVNKLFTRKYVIKGTDKDSSSEKIMLHKLNIKPDAKIKRSSFETNPTSYKGKLLITSLGKRVVSYLNDHFNENICSYSFTSTINNELDMIAGGKKMWEDVVQNVYDTFMETVNKEDARVFKNSDYEKNKISLGEKEGYIYQAYKDKYGWVVLKINATNDTDINKRRIRFEEIEGEPTMNLIDELYAYPILKGMNGKEEVFIKKGPYGLYCEITGTRFSIEDPSISLDKLIELYESKKKKSIKKWGTIEVLNGPYGVYIKKGKKNFAVPKTVKTEELTKEVCLDIIKNYKPKRFKKYSKK